MTNIAVLINEADTTQGRIIQGELTNMTFVTVNMPLNDAIEQAKGFLLAKQHEAEKLALSSMGQVGYDIQA